LKSRLGKARRFSGLPLERPNPIPI
jgi:hypothetical protein